MGLDQFFDKKSGTKGQREQEIDSINAANEL